MSVLVSFRCSETGKPRPRRIVAASWRTRNSKMPGSTLHPLAPRGAAHPNALIGEHVAQRSRQRLLLELIQPAQEVKHRLPAALLVELKRPRRAAHEDLALTDTAISESALFAIARTSPHDASRPRYARPIPGGNLGRKLRQRRSPRTTKALGFPWLSLHSGGGIRTRDLRVMRSPKGGQVGPERPCLLGLARVR